MTKIQVLYLVGVIIFSLLCFGAGASYLFQEQVNLATVIICCTFGFVLSLTAAYIYFNSDPWAREKARLEKFWWEVYRYKIKWSELMLPEWTREFPRLEIDPVQVFTAEQIYNGLVNCEVHSFTYRSKHVSNIDEALKNAKAVQARPMVNYAFAHTGGVEPDSAHLGTLYDDAISTGLIFMGPREYIIACARYEFETGNLYDTNELTRLSVLGSDGYTMLGYSGSGRGSFLGWNDCAHRLGGNGPRVIVFVTT